MKASFLKSLSSVTTRVSGKGQEFLLLSSIPNGFDAHKSCKFCSRNFLCLLHLSSLSLSFDLVPVTFFRIKVNPAHSINKKLVGLVFLSERRMCNSSKTETWWLCSCQQQPPRRHLILNFPCLTLIGIIRVCFPTAI